MQFEYTYKVKQLLPESGQMVVEFTPVDTTLTKVNCVIPILSKVPDMNNPGTYLDGLTINNIASYLVTWAPHDKWYAQYMILNHSDDLMPPT